jgi:AhpD family alkylhydroperoxidase
MLDLDKSVLALAASIAGGCRSCTDYHLGALERAGGGQAEKDRAFAAAARGTEALMAGMAAHAGRGPSVKRCCDSAADRIDALLGTVVALTVADAVETARWRGLAEASGCGAADLAVVQGLARQIRERAVHYAELAFGATNPASPGACSGSSPCGCG